MTLPEHSNTVPCGFGCGYLAENEADLNEHESTCDTGTASLELPPARPVRSIPRRVLRPRPHHGGDLR